MVENAKQSRLVEAVLQARRHVENGIQAHRHGAVCSSGSRWSASLDLPLVIMLRVYMECILLVLGESKCSQGCSALYADACQQIADAIRVCCNQLSVQCGRFVTTGVGDISENATCFAALSAYI